MASNQVVHIGSLMSACTSSFKTICNREHVSLQNLWGITIDRAWLPQGPLVCVQAVKGGTQPADGDATMTLSRSNRLAAVVVQVYQDLAQPYCRQRWEVGLYADIQVERSYCPLDDHPKVINKPGGPSAKVYAVNLVRNRGHVDVWNSATQQYQHCVAVLQTTSSSG